MSQEIKEGELVVGHIKAPGHGRKNIRETAFIEFERERLL